jgi:hypothetical protein
VIGTSDRRGVSFRDSAITFAAMTSVVVVLAVVVFILLDPRSQAFWGAKFSDLGTAARAVVNSVPWFR